MTEISVECIPFKKGTLTQEELNIFRETIDENFELKLKKEVQKIFRNAGIELSLDEIFED
ncbi:MAG: hypothetical protein IJI42_10125 [Methanobrevibacter sp.]|nr:hypothetical protein [Methanobrevibacter sp.]